MSSDPAVERYKLEQGRKGGANWFAWIGALSLINTVLVLTKTNFNFVFGLGITQVVDGLFAEASPAVRVIGVALNLTIAGAFVGISFLAKRYTWPFVTGIIVYAGDALIYLLAGQWIDLGFHVFALLMMSAGYRAARTLEMPPAPPVSEPVPATQAPASFESVS